jgi:hypothetical protein
MKSSLLLSAILTIAVAGSAIAQLPGAPVLQNAWATPGIVGAVNFGGSSDGSVIAGAAGWTPGNGRFQLSGGLGSRTLTGHGSSFAYGARVAMPLFGGGTSAIGIAAFAGIGGSAGAKKQSTDTTPIGTIVTADTTASTTEIPLGAAVGWRHAIGSNHGISVFGTPSYILYSGGSKNGGLFRMAIGADVGITSAIGATVGVDFGGSRARGFGGPSSTQYGIGVSYALGRR